LDDAGYVKHGFYFQIIFSLIVFKYISKLSFS
jgi:hypothetical protein